MELDNGIGCLVRERLRAAECLSALPSVSHAGLDSLTDPLTLELGDDTEDLQRKFTDRRGCVDDGFAEGLYPHPVLLDSL